MSQEGYIVNISGGIATITIDRPPVNVLTIDLMEGLAEEIKGIDSNDEVKGMIITGAGSKAFSAGVDVADHTPDKMERMLSSFGGLVKALLKSNKPSIAAVNGLALGGGLELVMACDMVIATEKSSFGQPEIQIGVYAPIANVLLPRMIGWKKAMELLLTGDAISAAEAEKIGLVNKVVAEEHLAAELEAFAARISKKSSAVLKWTRRCIVEAFDLPWEEGLGHADHLYLSGLMQTEDAAEGIRAFMEKRKPVFQNR